MSKIDSFFGQINRSENSKGLKLPKAFLNRFIHCIARYFPMFPSTRVWLHRKRGVKIKKNVFIGAEVFIDDAEPDLVHIKENVTIIARTAIIAHGYYPRHLQIKLKTAGNKKGVILEKGAYIGFGAIILPGVTIGENAIIGAGAIVAKSVKANEIVIGPQAQKIK
jgi:acetyltransferase-like isoleucine patch superfamily enzyme